MHKYLIEFVIQNSNKNLKLLKIFMTATEDLSIIIDVTLNKNNHNIRTRFKNSRKFF